MAVPVFSPQNQTGSRKIREPQNIKSKTGFRLVETAFLSGYQHPQALPMLVALVVAAAAQQNQNPQPGAAVAPAAAAIIIAARTTEARSSEFSFPQPNPHIIKYLLKIKAFLLHSYPMRYFGISCLSCFRFPAKKITSAESNH